MSERVGSQIVIAKLRSAFQSAQGDRIRSSVSALNMIVLLAVGEA